MSMKDELEALEGNIGEKRLVLSIGRVKMDNFLFKTTINLSAKLN